QDSMHVRSATRGLARAALETFARSTISGTDAGATVAIPTPEKFNLSAFDVRREVTVRMPADAPLRLRGQAVTADIDDVSGPLDLSVQAGAIRLRNTVVNGSDRIAARSGAIDFEGSLVGGSLDVETVSGAIHRAPPPGNTCSLHISATSAPALIP